MKKIKFIPTLLCLFSILLITSCEKEDSSPTTKPAVTGSMQGTWARNDGQASTYLKIDGTVAITCNNGTATTGTFNSSVPSITFIVSGSTYVFPMSMQGDKLILGVPKNSTNPNHVPTEYIKSSTWPCGGSGNTPKTIYYLWTTSSTCPFPSGYSLTCKHPGLPSTLTQNQQYGIMAGSIEIIVSSINGSTSSYHTLSEPPIGYKRIYTHNIFQFNNAVNRCNFYLNNPSALTYVDLPL